MFRINFLINIDFFKIYKTHILGKKKILALLLEYLTKKSVNKDIDNTSTTLEIEYINGIKTLFFLSIGDEIKFFRDCTSRQDKFMP